MVRSGMVCCPFENGPGCEWREHGISRSWTWLSTVMWCGSYDRLVHECEILPWVKDARMEQCKIVNKVIFFPLLKLMARLTGRVFKQVVFTLCYQKKNKIFSHCARQLSERWTSKILIYIVKKNKRHSLCWIKKEVFHRKHCFIDMMSIKRQYVKTHSGKMVIKALCTMISCTALIG